MNHTELPDWVADADDKPLTGEYIGYDNGPIWWKDRGVIFCLQMEDDGEFADYRIREAEEPEEMRAAIEFGGLYWLWLKVTAYRSDGAEIGSDSIGGVDYRCDDERERRASDEYVADWANEMARNVLAWHWNELDTFTRRQADQLIG